MKRTYKNVGLVLSMFTLVFALSCGNDDGGGIVINSDLEIEFANSTATVAEGSSVTVNLSFPEAPTAITISADVSGTATYTDDYTTSPAVANDALSISISEGATSASVTFTAMGDDEDEDDETVILTLQAAEGINLGDNTTLTVTITDVLTYDDISEVRGMDVGTEVTIKGVVTTPDHGFEDGNYFIQDQTAGVLIFHEDGFGGVSRGEEVVVEGTVDEYSGIVQIELTSISKTGETVDFPDATTITSANITPTDALQGSLVTIADVTIAEDEWPVEANTTSSGTNVSASVSDVDFIIRIDRGESFYDGSDIPGEPLTITGILHRFNDDVQIMPFVDGDVVSGGSLGTLTVTPISEAFTGTANGSFSDPKTFTIIGTGIQGDVTVTASDYFQVSTDGTQFASSTTLADVSAEQTVYARFAPSSGLNETLTGTIEVGADNALSESFSVEGSEIGNAAVVIAYTSFEEPTAGDQYVDTGDASTDHDLVNNSEQSMVDFTSTGGEMGFDATYVNTRDDVGLTDGDYVGVTDYTGDVGSFLDGTQGYNLSDTDGKMILTFDAIDISSHTDVNISVNYFVISTGWETDDLIRIYVDVDGSVTDLLNTDGSDVNDLSIEDSWNNLSQDISGSSVTLVVELDSNSGNEGIYLDDIKITGFPPAGN